VTITQRSGESAVRIHIGQQGADQQGGKASNRRKLTLEELEVEGLDRSSEGSAVGQRDADEEEEEEFFDLNSLVEGAVDDEEDLASHAGYHTAPSDSGGSMKRIERVDDPSSSDEDVRADLASMAVHQGSVQAMRDRHHGGATSSSPPPRLPPKKKISHPAALTRGQPGREGRSWTEKSDVPSKMFLPNLGESRVPPVVPPPPGSSAGLTATETSDFDSVASTTSASYHVADDPEETAPEVPTPPRPPLPARPPTTRDFPSSSSSNVAVEASGGRKWRGEAETRSPGVVELERAGGGAQGQERLVAASAAVQDGEPAGEEQPEEEVVRGSEGDVSKSVPSREEVAENGDGEDLSEVGQREKRGGTRKKKSVSALIARFESEATSTGAARSVTPERSARSHTPDGTSVARPSSAAATLFQQVADPAATATSSRPSPEEEAIVQAPPPVTSAADACDVGDDQAGVTEPQSPRATTASSSGRGRGEISAKEVEEGEKGEKVKPQPDVIGEEELPLGAEAIDPDTIAPEDEEEDEEMAKTMRNQRGYTSYVFISSDPGKADEAGSVVSAVSNGSRRSAASGPLDADGNRVSINVKESAASCVVLQDGRASNISIVSTESSELGLPHSPEKCARA